MESFALERIELTNFVCFERLTVDVGSGKYLVTGANGAGKSTLLSDSILFCLYNKARSKDILYPGSEKGSVKISFRSGDNAYTVERVFPDTSRRSPVIYLNGEPLNFKKSSLREAEIVKIVGVSYDLFARTIVVRQNGIPNFGLMSPTARKGLIEELVGYRIWDDMRKPFSKHLKSKHEECMDVMTSVSSSEQKMVSLNTQIETLKGVEAEKADKLKEIEAHTAGLGKRLQATERKMQAIRDKYPKLKMLDKIKSKFQKLSYDIQQCHHILSRRDCPTCNRPYPEERFAGLEDKVKKSEQTIESLRGVLGSLGEAEKKLLDLNSRHISLHNELKGIERKKSDYLNEYNFDEMSGKLAELVSQVNMLKDNLRNTKQSYDNVKYIDTLLQPSSVFRTEVLAEQARMVAFLANEIKKNIFPGIEILLDLTEKGVSFQIKRDGKLHDYEVFSGGERRRIDVVMVFAFQRFLTEHSGVVSSFVVLDEIFDSLDLSGIGDILNTIDILYPDAKSIYVISHKEEIKQAFSRLLRVERGEGGSCVTESEGFES